MSHQIIIGLACEGTTDQRFLGALIERTFNEVAWDCNSSVEIFPVEFIQSEESTFVECVIDATRKAVKRGVMVLCVHTDADDRTDERAFGSKIRPAWQAVQECTEEVCRLLIPVVPVRMSESWMLADTELLKREIGVNRSDSELGLHRSPESVSDPKECIRNVIRQATAETSRRRRRYELSLGDLYQPIGQNINLQKLRRLPSYAKFEDAVRDVLRNMQLL